MKIEKLVKTKEYYMDIIKRLDQIEGKPVKGEARVKLKELLKHVASNGFTRIDKDNIITLHMNGFPSQLSEVIRIFEQDGIIKTDCWAFWKTIQGIEEQIQEARAYMRELEE